MTVKCGKIKSALQLTVKQRAIDRLSHCNMRPFAMQKAAYNITYSEHALFISFSA